MLLTPLIGPESTDVRCKPENQFDRTVLRLLTEICGLREEPTTDGKIVILSLPTRLEAGVKLPPALKTNGHDEKSAEPRPRTVERT